MSQGTVTVDKDVRTGKWVTPTGMAFKLKRDAIAASSKLAKSESLTFGHVEDAELRTFLEGSDHSRLLVNRFVKVTLEAALSDGDNEDVPHDVSEDRLEKAFEAERASWVNSPNNLVLTHALLRLYWGE